MFDAPDKRSLQKLMVSPMRPFASVILLIGVLAVACPDTVSALDCAKPYWWNYERLDGDPQQRRLDAEARAALANMGPMIFRGRFAWARDLSDVRKNQSAVFLISLKDVDVLQGEMPRSARDRRILLVYYAWCDTRCEPASRWWPRGLTTYSARPFKEGPVRDTKDDGSMGGKVVYSGRVDAVTDACEGIRLTPLQQQLLNAPADEIARLIREYPFHAVGNPQPTDSD